VPIRAWLPCTLDLLSVSVGSRLSGGFPVRANLRPHTSVWWHPSLAPLIKRDSRHVRTPGRTEYACSRPRLVLPQSGVVRATVQYVMSERRHARIELLAKGQNPLQQFPRSKSVTSWRGQKSVVSVVSCRFPNSITVYLLPTSYNTLATSPSTGKLRGNVCNGFWALTCPMWLLSPAFVLSAPRYDVKTYNKCAPFISIYTVVIHGRNAYFRLAALYRL